jgi:DNA-binding Lrp family transcriptional regulator
MSEVQLDEIDRHILQLLQDNARMSNVDLAGRFSYRLAQQAIGEASYSRAPCPRERGCRRLA